LIFIQHGKDWSFAMDIKLRDDFDTRMLRVAIIRLVGAILLEQNDEWAVQRTHNMTLETLATMSDDPLVSLPVVQA